MKKIRIIILLGIVGVLGLVGILSQNKRPVQNSGKLEVATSFYPLYFFASQIGGDKVDVFNITPASAEPHDYEPTTQDIVRISDSALLILNGGKLEAWGDKIKDQLKGSPTRVVTAGEGLADKTLDEDGKTIQDPHIWQDPLLAKKEVAVIEKAYEKIDSKNAAYYHTNAQKLELQLDELDKEYATGLISCVLKDFVTSHAAFGYMAAQYGLHQVAISGVSPDEEPSGQKLAEVANLVKKENIKVIFFETLVSPKLSQTIAQETGAKAMVLDPLEGISPEDVKAGHTYLTVMKDNLSALRDALQCTK
jgi:zinc transport system substrate-binding protein